MSREMVSCAGGIDQCIALVKEVQSCLGRKSRSMNQAIEKSSRTIAEKFRYDIQDALRHASLIIEAEWRLRAFDLISRCCEDINANMNYLFNRRSDNGESSQNGIEDAISSLVHLAQVFSDFGELRNLGKYLEKLCGERPESEEFNNLLSTRSAGDYQKEKKVREIADEQIWDLGSVMVYVNMIFDKHRRTFQTLLFILEVISYGLNLTADNSIRILVPVLVLSATSFLFIHISLIWRCCREGTMQVIISQMEWVESSFSIFQLAADILKVAGHAKSSSMVMEAWVLVFAVIGYDAILDGVRSNRRGIRN